MTSGNTYNGWTNYVTWRVNLEIFDGIDPRDNGWEKFSTYELGQTLKEYAIEILEMDMPDGLALEYARAFISDVNWYEIAKHMRENYELTDDKPEEAFA